MKSFIALLAVVAVAAADVSHIAHGSEADAVIKNQAVDVAADNFKYRFETSNGISGTATGFLTNAGRENAAIVVEGVDQYTAPDGSKIETRYTADENGYHPEGAHLPTAPPTQPIPEYILKSIEYNKAHAPSADTEILTRRF